MVRDASAAACLQRAGPLETSTCCCNREVRTREGVLTTSVVPALGRGGYAARALLYAWLGLLVCRSALTGSGQPDFAGTFAAADAFGGPPLLMLLSIGLWGYAIWRWTEALRNPEHRSVWSRQDIAIRGAVHAWLGVTAARLVVSHWIEPRPIQHWMLMTFTYAFGRLVIAAAGAALLWFAWNEARLAKRGMISTHFDDRGELPETRTAVQWLGRIGMIGRAIAFGLVAISVLTASIRPAATRDVDLGVLLEKLCSVPGGPLVVFSTGVGLTAYGGYLAALAWRRRMPT